MLMAKVVSDNFDEPGRSQHPDMVQESIIKWFSNWRYEQKPWGIIWRHSSNCCNTWRNMNMNVTPRVTGSSAEHVKMFFSATKLGNFGLFVSLCSMAMQFLLRKTKTGCCKCELTVFFDGGFTGARQVSKLNILKVFSCLSLCSWTKWIQYLNLFIYDQYLDELTSLSNDGAWDQESHLGLCNKEHSKPVDCWSSVSRVIQEPLSELNIIHNPWMWLKRECSEVLVLLVYVILPCFSENVVRLHSWVCHGKTKMQIIGPAHGPCYQQAHYVLYMPSLWCFAIAVIPWLKVHLKLKVFNTHVRVY